MTGTDPQPGQLFTVGHGARPIDDFLALLRGAGIERVVDVRTAPGSRRHPQFGRDALAGELEGAGIGYVWRRELGGFRRARGDSRHVALESDSFRGYADHMETDQFRRAIGWLLETSRQEPTAVMCAESLWWRCHRRMIADGATARGWRVVHVMARGDREAHRLHPAARMESDALVYDRSTEQGRLTG